VRQTFQWFRDHDLELPVNPIQGTRLIWKLPSQSLIRDILHAIPSTPVPMFGDGVQ